ncbi:hypothetical protein DVH24_006006 [Malus domestica]|uniref:Uncharacterized protein n=1 Tax=Malus domestica TaxID=3750 RepID=A0A498IR57_MALDO|nr:hypothetical protein DVH24_006006 [Malus domestica]
MERLLPSLEPETYRSWAKALAITPMKSIDATQVSNVVNGCTSLLPIIGAIIADSFFGCFPVILISSCVSFLGLVLFTLTATLDSSRPSSCENGSSLCETPSKVHVSWGLGFGLSALVNLIGLVIFASGTHFYCRDKPQGSPFVNIARVIVASIRKWKVKLSSSREDYHYHNDGEAKATPAAPKKSFTFRFLNNAALETEGDLKPDGSIARPWSIIGIPTMARTLMCLTLAAGGWQANLVVYLIEEFNVKSIDATQVSNVVNGCTSLFPIIGAIVADSFFGCFPVILISSCVSFLGLVLFTLTATLDSLRPPSCENGSSLCETPSKVQFAVLYASITLGSIGLGGTRFTIATMGANQFDKPKNQGIFFNWFFFAMYTATVVSSTVVVYIEDSVSWGLGFGLSALVNLIGLVVFSSGIHFYRRDKPQGSPFVNIARVVVASIRKWNVKLTSRREDYHYHNDGEAKTTPAAPKKSFRYQNFHMFCILTLILSWCLLYCTPLVF